MKKIMFPLLFSIMVLACCYLSFHFKVRDNQSKIKFKPQAGFREEFTVEKTSSSNSAKFSKEWYASSLYQSNDDDGFHVVTYFALLTKNILNNSLLWNGAETPSLSQLKGRQQEIEETLQRNLDNSLIKNVHVLFYHPEIAEYLQKLALNQSDKLVMHITYKDPTVRSTFDYIQSFLMNKIVIVMHMDISLGRGFHLIKKHILTNKIMYALTRHSITNDTRCNSANYATCDVHSHYIGSHDAFVFYVNNSFSRDMLDELDTFKPTNAGSENVLIWLFIHSMGYKVLNPCQTLVVYHAHCVPVRSVERSRVNNNGKSGLAPFSKDLF